MKNRMRIIFIVATLMAGCRTIPEKTADLDRREFYQEIATHDPEAMAKIKRAPLKLLNKYLFPEHTPLDVAVTHHNFPAAQLLIERGVNVNRGASDGNTPLLSATQGNDKQMVRLLLVAGANPNQKNRSGETPLDLAFYENSHTAGAVLKEFGATFSRVMREKHNQFDAATWFESL